MVQIDDDIVSGVGLTALAVAAARAVETATEDGLVRDPYAAAFVAEARAERFRITPTMGDPVWQARVTYIGVRSRFYDEYFGAADVDQAVILAAGLDTRAYRLPWRDADVYEIDQPRVLEFKQQVLDATGAEPACRRHTVPLDLRADWAAALVAAGFDRTRPTAWLAEGLLIYLPASAEEALFDTIAALSAPGSHVAFDRMPDSVTTNDLQGALKEGQRSHGVPLSSLVNTESRRNPIDWLRGNGWTAEVDDVAGRSARYGRPLADSASPYLGLGQLVTASLAR